MKGALGLMLATMTVSSSFASDYSEGLQFARKKSGEGRSLFQKFNTNELPDFTQNPKEAGLKPSQKGELETAGKRFVESDAEAEDLYQEAYENKERPLDKASQNQAKKDYEQAGKNPDTAPCSDGACIPVKNEESNDFSEGAVEMGALGGVAEEVKDGQLQSGVPGIFKAQNITCRTVYKYNRINFCRKDKDILSASQAEKALHKAQREKRAIVLSGGGTFCSKKKKILGKRRCVEKKQSWCVFQSKLARIVQVEARRQLGMNLARFGVMSMRQTVADLLLTKSAALILIPLRCR
ncbi:conjugal transfer protein TraN (plasmid) [Legionella sp. D16C41]|uniref:conjugal transfer protein TraN n=1 Tax=Legionella sp. D16C41 TaxID=3402688 RepID=UPI003AF78420